MASRFLTITSLLFSISINAQENNFIAANDGISSVLNHKSGISIETRIVIEKESGQVKIIFWQETENGFIFKNINWKGEIALLLDNGESLRLRDANLKGHMMQPGAYIAGMYVPDLYQRYSAYYLSPEERELLKKHSVVLVSYFLDDNYEKDMQHLEVNDSGHSLKAQLVAIGK